MNFIGSGQRLTREDLEGVAEELKLHVSLVEAVLEVECPGSGFGPQNQPTILFEPHVFYRRLGATPERRRAVDLGVAYPTWGERPYPPSQKDRYAQLLHAYSIHPPKSLESCSWGKPQIMGFNYRASGYETIDAFVTGMKHSEGEQVRAFGRFLTDEGLVDVLKQRDWATFARRYNGPGYAKHRYDKKLEIAYQKYSTLRVSLAEGARVHATRTKS